MRVKGYFTQSNGRGSAASLPCYNYSMNPYETAVRLVVFCLGAGGLMIAGAMMADRTDETPKTHHLLFVCLCSLAMWWAAW